MKLTIGDSSTFLNDFLSPLSRISDGGVLKFKDNKISSLAATNDNTIIIYSEYKTPTPSEEVSLNIPDLKKLYKLLSLIDGVVELEVDRNSISYSSDITRFKYHLYEDGILSMPSLNMSKLQKIAFNNFFTVPSNRLGNLLKGSTLNADINKVYISSNTTKVHAELTDKSRHNVDNYATLISDDFISTNGSNLNSIPLNFEIMRLLNSSKICEFKAKYASSIGVFNFEVNSPDVNINYIVSALTN
jgi:hypothetical protein